MYFLMTNKVGMVVEEEGLTWKWKVTQNILWHLQERQALVETSAHETINGRKPIFMNSPTEKFG